VSSPTGGTLNPAEAAAKAVEADLASARFLAGAARKRWRKLSYAFPLLYIAVAAVEPDQRPSEYEFQFELTGFPGVGPAVRIWDVKANSILATDRRPKGSPRVLEAFKDWGDHTVYRPWDRLAGAHNNWARDFPALAWHPRRDLTFILEDLNGLLASNALARAARAEA
jgi:hypothetical protein